MKHDEIQRNSEGIIKKSSIAQTSEAYVLIMIITHSCAPCSCAAPVSSVYVESRESERATLTATSEIHPPGHWVVRFKKTRRAMDSQITAFLETSDGNFGNLHSLRKQTSRLGVPGKGQPQIIDWDRPPRWWSVWLCELNKQNLKCYVCVCLRFHISSYLISLKYIAKNISCVPHIHVLVCMTKSPSVPASLRL